MFLIIPLVEFLHVLGVDINVHHENPATFLCHVSVSSVNRSRRRLPRLVGTRTSAPGAQERYETTNRGPKATASTTAARRHGRGRRRPRLPQLFCPCQTAP